MTVQTHDKRFVKRMQKHEQDKYLASLVKTVPDAHEKAERVEIVLEPIKLLQKMTAQQHNIAAGNDMQAPPVHDDDDALNQD